MALAFLGAEGFGAATRGAFAGPTLPVILMVTNLNDSGPGSLRAACEYAGPRVIWFAVSGTIINLKPLKIDQDYVTIYGQSSPNGICLAGEEVRIQCAHGIMQYVRIRTGEHQPARDTFENRDCLNFGKAGQPAHDWILDHCSFSWGVDESVTVWFGSYNISITNYIIAEPLFRSVHPKGPHSMGLLFGNGSGNITAKDGLIYASNQRGPQFDSTTGLIQYVNAWNIGWGVKCLELEGTVGNVDIIACGGRRGPDSALTPSPEMISVQKEALPTLRLYIADCVSPTRADPRMDCWSMVRDPGGHLVPEGANRVFAPHAGPALAITTAAEALAKIIATGGASKPFRDAVDHRVAYRAAMPCFKPLAKGGKSWLVDSTDQLQQYTPPPLGAWPDLSGGTPPVDTDQDGLPDDWEIAHGLDPDNPGDAVQDSGDGYAWIEKRAAELAAV